MIWYEDESNSIHYDEVPLNFLLKQSYSTAVKTFDISLD